MIEKKTFKNGEVLKLDQEYVDCLFENCTLIFNGVDSPRFNRCRFGEHYNWHFDGPANITLAFLQSLFNAGQTELVEKVFEDIRTGKIGVSNTRN